MTWPALGRDPAPGDEGQVLALADRFRDVSRAAEDLVGGLRSVDGATGAETWSGPAADAFRRVLADIGPAGYRLTTAYVRAEQAVRRYARELADSQHAARLAEADGEKAMADRAQARAERDRADANARSFGAEAATAQGRWTQGQAQANFAPGDPVYQAQMQSYLAEVAAQRDRARAQEAQARRDAAGAAARMADADARLARARARGAQAGRDHMDAGWRLVNELRSAEPPGVRWGLLTTVAHGVSEIAGGVENVVDLFATKGIQHLKDGAVRWKKGLGFLRQELDLTAKQVEALYERLEKLSVKLQKLNKDIEKLASKFGSTLKKIAPKIKTLGVVSIALDTMEAAGDQHAEDAEKRPTLNDTERLFREIAAAVAVGALGAAEVLGADMLIEIGAAIGGSLGAAAGGVGAAPGAVLGGLIGMALSTGAQMWISEGGPKDAIREWGASIGSQLYHKLVDIAGGSSDPSVLAGAADTSGSTWKAMAA